MCQSVLLIVDLKSPAVEAVESVAGPDPEVVATVSDHAGGLHLRETFPHRVQPGLQRLLSHGNQV